MIHVKDVGVLWSTMVAPFDERLCGMLNFLDDRYPDRIVITSGHRPGDPGVHGTKPCRGVDIRSWVFPEPEYVVGLLNNRYTYDPARPGKYQVAMYHSALPDGNITGKGFHIHLQVHPNTETRGDYGGY